MEHAVPELQLWKANVLGVASYFRTSKNHKATLLALFPDAHEFPAYFEVRFAEHLVNVIEAVLHNRDGCIEVWKQISAEGTRHEKAEASGFCVSGLPDRIKSGSLPRWVTLLKFLKTCKRIFKVMTLY